VKVSSTELPPRQVSLEIEVEQERVDRATDDAYRRLAGRVDVPGFRRGKAPRSMVERMIGRERILEDALEHLLPQLVADAMEQEKIEPYTRPRVETVDFDPLRVKAVVGLAPKVELGDYQQALHVSSEAPQVGDEQVESVIQRLRDSYAQWAPVERPVQTGDQIGLDLRATVAGRDKPLVDAKDAAYNVDPEGAQPAPGFFEQVVGMQPGEHKTFTLPLPDDYSEKEVAGQPAHFEVTLHWVKERELPELNDEFAQQLGDFSDVQALRTAVEKQVREREEQRVREQMEEAAMNRLVELSTIEFPPQLVEHQAQHMLESFQRRVEQQGLQLSQYLRLIGKDQEQFEHEIRSEAETRVRRSLALDAFAAAEHIDGEQSEDLSRERRALARLIELATANGITSAPEKTTAAVETSDTQGQTVTVETAAEEN
jgi:trigger factor